MAPDAAVVSAVLAIEGAVLNALRAGLGEGVTGVFAAPPPRAACPYVLLGETVAVDWGTKDVPGREVRLTIVIEDADWGGGEHAERLGALGDMAEDAVLGLAREIGDWRVASLVPTRSRRVRRGERRHAQIIEFRARVLRAQ